MAKRLQVLVYRAIGRIAKRLSDFPMRRRIALGQGIALNKVENIPLLGCQLGHRLCWRDQVERSSDGVPQD